jgi:hypothetical protein
MNSNPLMRFAPYILVLGLLAGCVSSPRYDEQVRQCYRAGMTRDEAHAVLVHARLLSSVLFCFS